MKGRFIAILFCLTLAGCAFRSFTSASGSYPHLRMGNPSGATASTSNKNNYLMQKPYFALSYNNRKGTPNWVSWRLTGGDVGRARRVQFYPDDSLPSGFQRVVPSDYTDSGFDRGHMCPHGDRSAGSVMSKATFVMTNIIPQSPNVNRQAWEQLESYCRDLANAGKVLYIISSPAGVGGVGSDGALKQIARDSNVTVPAKCWKVIMVLNGGFGDDLRKVNRRTRLIGVIMPNDMTVGDDWARYRVSVAAVEKLTGYTFFSRVPSSTIGPLKKKVDSVTIPPPVPYSERRGGRG